MSDQHSDEDYLRLCLDLAKKGLSWTNPNPMVGAVIVKDGKIIAQGYHQKVGLNHAEIEAMRTSQTDLRNATLYVSLEPCSTFGKTPPCVDEIIRSKFKRVVFATLDPNPQNAGLGLSKLNKAGIKTTFGLLTQQSRQLNEAFFTYYEKKRPLITLKFAASLDGKIATVSGDSKWITNETARKFARMLRAQNQAILVGINTVLKDNPNLGVGIQSKKDPLRIILDPALKIPLQSDVLRDQNVLIATTKLADQNKLATLTQKGIAVLIFPQSIIPINNLLQQLWQRQIISVLIEGGSKTLGAFYDSKLVDKFYGFYSPIILGGEKSLTAIGGIGLKKVSLAKHLTNIAFKKFGDNFLISGNF